MLGSLREAWAVLAVLSRYWLTIRPQARGELRYWKERSLAIPDPFLRDQALSNLCQEDLVSESATVYAVFSSRAHRKNVTRLLTTFQVMYNYLDSVNEQPVPDPLRNGFQLHQALVTALDPDASVIDSHDFYEYCSQSHDGGYLEELIVTCQGYLRALPSSDAVLPVLRRSVIRCVEGQSYTHAAIYEDSEQLREWALRHDRIDSYHWWEIAAAGVGGSMCVLALLAAAGDVETTSSDAASIDSAYFPHICALATLLDSLADYECDKDAMSHSSIAYYETNLEAAQRLGAISERAGVEVRQLRRGRTHAVITAGIAAFFMASSDTNTPFAEPVMHRVVESLGPVTPLIVATMRLQRRWRPGLGRSGSSPNAV